MFETPQYSRHRAARRGAFTLTEVLVVITIIILALALSVPLFNVFSASRSVDGAENLVSASLQRARARAIGLQERRGLFFFADPVTGNVGMVTVMVINNTIPTIDLELDTDGQPLAEVEPLPSGVGAAFLGQNSANTFPEWRPLGLIMFDGFGRVEQMQYTVVKTSLLGNRAGLNVPTTTVPTSLFSQVAMELYEKRLFVDGAGSSADPMATLAYDGPQGKWLDANGQLMIINRYNGTVLRGQ